VRAVATPSLDGLGPADPRTVSAWRLLGRLGVGGMGVVYLAERNGQRAALKVIHPGLAADPTFVMTEGAVVPMVAHDAGERLGRHSCALVSPELPSTESG
jgi:hypothetical protein